MPYAAGRTYFDADSHLMETPEWLASYADPEIRPKLQPYLGGKDRLAHEAVAAVGRHYDDPSAMAAAEDELMTRKGWSALGSFDPALRSRALDLLGFERQLVFSTFSVGQYESAADLDVVYGGADAHNRGIAEFCGADHRLVGVGQVPLVDPDRAAVAVDDAIAAGCGSVLLPSAPARDISPTHPAYDGVWARLAEAGVPFMLHLGGGGNPLDPAFVNNGRPMPGDMLGDGGEGVRAKDFMVLNFGPEVFLTAMVLDGVFERYPHLRCGVIEQGAGWVISLLERMDFAQRSFKKTEPLLAALPEKASDYIRRQVKFTPFPHEPVGWLIEHAGDELFMFSSDYPHPEGGKDPLGKFEASLAGTSPDAVERFYSGNYAELMGMVPAST
ncbi:MAG: amidohydrolase family protein [Actinobacteria bacterium]|nr:amidohydrolase family protein [Actinomycetota bacterium]